MYFILIGVITEEVLVIDSKRQKEPNPKDAVLDVDHVG